MVLIQNKLGGEEVCREQNGRKKSGLRGGACSHLGEYHSNKKMRKQSYAGPRAQLPPRSPRKDRMPVRGEEGHREREF